MTRVHRARERAVLQCERQANLHVASIGGNAADPGAGDVSGGRRRSRERNGSVQDEGGGQESDGVTHHESPPVRVGEARTVDRGGPRAQRE
jgi:hypothetical protein